MMETAAGGWNPGTQLIGRVLMGRHTGVKMKIGMQGKLCGEEERVLQ